MSDTFVRTYRLGPRFDALLEVRFFGEAFSASLIANVINAVEKSAFQVESGGDRQAETRVSRCRCCGL
jgi:hypothetical protein